MKKKLNDMTPQELDNLRLCKGGKVMDDCTKCPLYDEKAPCLNEFVLWKWLYLEFKDKEIEVKQ